MSGRLDLTIEQGASFSRVITIEDSIGNPVNINSDTFRGQVRSSYKSGKVQANFTFTIYTDGSDGKVAISLSDEDTALMDAGKNFVYDVEWINSNGTVRRLLEGNANITAEVTR